MDEGVQKLSAAFQTVQNLHRDTRAPHGLIEAYAGRKVFFRVGPVFDQIEKRGELGTRSLQLVVLFDSFDHVLGKIPEPEDFCPCAGMFKTAKHQFGEQRLTSSFPHSCVEASCFPAEFADDQPSNIVHEACQERTRSLSTSREPG